MRIAYLSDMCPLDTNLYSGGNARIYNALKAHVGDVDILPQDWGQVEPLRRAIFSAPDAMNIRARWRAHYLLRRAIGQNVSAILASGRYDVLFGAYALHSLAGVHVPPGTVTAFTSDAVQTVYRTSEIGEAHPSMFPLGRALDGWAEAREREVLQSLDVAFWPSEWLCTAVADRYDLGPAVGHVVEWGANIAPPPRPEPKHLTPGGPVNLLVIGRDWHAKGGPVAFETLQTLRACGLDARLVVIGCTPPAEHVTEQVTVLSELNKAVPEDLARFEQALAEAHFLVQPSFESYGFAFCEASAYGLPSLCLRVGGVPVRDGLNGHALAPGAGAASFAGIIQGYAAAPERYAALSLSARDMYETRLNWPAWGARVRSLLEQKVDAVRGLRRVASRGLHRTHVRGVGGALPGAPTGLVAQLPTRQTTPVDPLA